MPVIVDPRRTGGRILPFEPYLRAARPQARLVLQYLGPGEARLEREDATSGPPRVHNYGHGGSGVTLSWGCAEETLRIVRQELEEG